MNKSIGLRVLLPVLFIPNLIITYTYFVEIANHGIELMWLFWLYLSLIIVALTGIVTGKMWAKKLLGILLITKAILLLGPGYLFSYYDTIGWKLMAVIPVVGIDLLTLFFSIAISNEINKSVNKVESPTAN